MTAPAKAAEGTGPFSGSSKPTSGDQLFRAARNQALDEIRRQKRIFESLAYLHGERKSWHKPGT